MRLPQLSDMVMWRSKQMNAAKRLCVKNWSPTRCASTISMLSGPTDVPLLRVSMGEHFKSIKAEFGDSPALISYHQQKRLTYYELDDLSDKMMAGLAAVGVKKGDRVGACFNNTWEFGVTSIGIEKLGAILVSINPALPDNQFKSLLSFATCSTLIISSFLHLPYRPPRSSLPFLKSLANDLQANQLECPEVPSLSRIILVGDKPNERGHLGITDFADLLQYEPIPLPALHPDDVINLQFTSGTTGVAKGAALTHCNILNNGVHIGRRMGLRGGSDKVCIPVPVFHCFGLVLGNGAAWGTGSTVVYPAAAFDAKQTLRCVRDEKCTALHAVPTMFVGMFEEEKEINRGGFESLRTGIAAGSSIPASLMSKIHRKLNLIEQVICYGMTETSPVSAMTQPDDPLVKRLETVGTVMPHVQIKIVDTNDAILPIDKHGEICVAGYLLQKGYWDNPEKTREVMKYDKDGKLWMYTGDEGALDRDGYLRVTGRIKDLIIRGGENIHPLEIENVLFKHPNIAEASVVGVSDEKYGEVVAAFVVMRKGVPPISAQTIRDWVLESLPRHLVPKHVFFVQDFQNFKTLSGKIRKVQLREEGRKLQNSALELP